MYLRLTLVAVTLTLYSSKSEENKTFLSLADVFWQPYKKS